MSLGTGCRSVNACRQRRGQPDGHVAQAAIIHLQCPKIGELAAESDLCFIADICIKFLAPSTRSDCRMGHRHTTDHIPEAADLSIHGIPHVAALWPIAVAPRRQMLDAPSSPAQSSLRSPDGLSTFLARTSTTSGEMRKLSDFETVTSRPLCFP